jgi:hypothetical protein
MGHFALAVIESKPSGPTRSFREAFDGTGEFRFGTDDGIELLADLAGDRAGPPRSDLAHIEPGLFLLSCQGTARRRRLDP